MAETAPWITYRPELKVLDCTIRDGGLINNHQFTEELVRAVYDTCVAAGVDYMEVGYKASPQAARTRASSGRGSFATRTLLNRVFADHDAEAHRPEAGRDGRRRQVRLARADRAAATRASST